MDPYTPKPTRTSIRKSKLTLSAKQYSKITGTIASSRRSRFANGDLREDAELALEGYDEPSFIAEKSFVNAPLNSRVPAKPSSAKAKGKAKAESLDKVPVEVQEALILEDLLFVLMGIEGIYITYPEDYVMEDENPLHGLRFVISQSLDPSLRDLVERILPLATYYTSITSFVSLRSHLEFGLVNHALCAAIRDMLKDYHTLLSQLEHAFTTSPSFSLQKLWFYVHPTLHTLSLIHGLVLELAAVEDGPSSSSSPSSDSEIDPEEARKNEELGLGGATLKAVISELKGGLDGSGGLSTGPATGGEVLTILHERMQRMSGDPGALSLHKALIRAAGRPYAEMLVGWIRHGELNDPYEEMCVKEGKYISKTILDQDYVDDYWERRYTLRDGTTGRGRRHQAGVPPPRAPGGRLPGGACIPPLLETWKHKVLLAGKYLNVLQECGKDITQTEIQIDTDLAMDDEKFYKAIDDAYAFANRTLVHVLLHDEALLAKLRSLKHYFFLSHSSFIVHFLDAAHAELRKPARGASLDRLQGLLDVALQIDSGGRVMEGEDPLFKEDLKVKLAERGIYDFLIKVLSENGKITMGGSEEGEYNEPEAGNEGGKKDREKEERDKKSLTAIDAFQLDYNVKFPLSLVISRRSVVRYQFIFRFIFHMRFVEQVLTSMWIDQMTPGWRAPAPGYTDFIRWRTRVMVLRARMLAFVQQILAFITAEVLDKQWRAMEKRIKKVQTVEDLLREHESFMDSCLKDGMLTGTRLLKNHSKLMWTCSTYAAYTSQFNKNVNNAFGEETEEDRASGMKKRWEFLDKFEKNFNHWFDVHLDCVRYYASSENVALLPLVTRLESVRNREQ